MLGNRIRRAALFLSVGLAAAAIPAVAAPPVPGVTIEGMPAEGLIGEAFHFQVVVSPAPSGRGFGPFVELYLELAGADCTGLPGLPERCDGLHFDQAVVQLASSTEP